MVEKAFSYVSQMKFFSRHFLSYKVCLYDISSIAKGVKCSGTNQECLNKQKKKPQKAHVVINRVL